MTWQSRLLGDFITIKHGFAFSSQNFERQGRYVVLTPGHFFEAGGFRRQDRKERFLNIEPPAQYVLAEGALVVAMTEQAPGLLGSCAVVPESDRYLHNQRLGLVTISQPERLRADFLYYTLNSPSVRRQIQRSAGGMKVRHTSPTKIGAVWFMCPPVDAQRRITQVLIALDAVLISTRRALQAKRGFKRSLMRQILTGEKRFPEFQCRPWRSSRLADHVAGVTRRNLKGLTLVLTASGEHGLVDQRRYFNRRVAATDLTGYYLLTRGEFAYNRSAMNGYPYGAVKRLDVHDEGALSPLYLCFAIRDSKLNSDFLRHLFESGVLDRQLRPIARVGARAHGLLNVSDEDFLSVSIPLPELDEQHRIAEMLNTSERELGLLAAHQEHLEREKRALLLKLMAGDIAVS